MDNKTLAKVLALLDKVIPQWEEPIVGVMARLEGDKPFYVLISTVLSLRTKDATTRDASFRLFARAKTPHEMLKLSEKEIAKLIYPVGFYNTKAKNILQICKILIEKYQGHVPRTIDELTALPGVGRKTANLVVTIGYDDDGICVDVHVHRISNRWGYLKTKVPDETEMVLRGQLPRKYWKGYNDRLVTFGQNLCLPVSPWCSKCPVKKYCPQIGVKRSR